MTPKPQKQQLLAEFIGSMFLVMTAVSSMMMFTYVLEAPKGVAVFANAVSVSFVLCVLIEMFNPISGAHFNPVVTMVMLLEKKIEPLKALAYVLCQFVGGIAGTMFSHLMFFDEVGGLFSISDNVRSGYVFFGEFFGTFILVLAILMLAVAKSGRMPIIIGFLVGSQVMATSSTMFANPQVTLARMFTDTVSGIRPIDGMVFIAVQVMGALLAYVVWRVVLRRDSQLS